MSTTEYNGAYKGEVISLLKQAISGLKSCKSVSIDIPSDFEAAGTLRNALNTLKQIDIKGAVSEIKSASADFERAENELNNYLGKFLNLVQHKKNNNEKIGKALPKNTAEHEKKKGLERLQLIRRKKYFGEKSIAEMERNKVVHSKITREQFLQSVREVAKEVYDNRNIYRYGDSNTSIPCDWESEWTEFGYTDKMIKYISCDRLVSKALYNLGYTDMDVGGHNVTSRDWMRAHGFKIIKDKSKLQPGDIVIFGNYDTEGETIESFASHTMVIESYDSKTGLCSKYDMGSDKRIQTKQPFKNVPLDEWNEIGNPNNKDKFFSYVYRVNDTKTKISFPYKQLEKSKNQNVLAGFASDDVSSGLEKLLSLKNNKDSKAILLDKTQVSTALEKLKKSTSINKTKSYIAIEEEKKGKEKIRDQERTKYFGGKSIAEEEKRKGIELLDKKLVAAKNLIRHNNYPNETQTLLETLKAEEQYAHDGKMLGYSKAMKNGDVKKVLDIAQNKNLTEAQQLIVVAECIHSYLENSVKNDNPNDNYKYYTETFDKLNKTFEDSKESYKNVCCATYVSWVLKEIGYLKDDDIKSKETMHRSVLLNQLFKEKKEQFTEVAESQGLKAGDILFYDYGSGKGHIEIFAGYDENGDKIIYNCGSDYWIASEFPSARDGSSFQTKKKTPTRVWRIIDK